MKRSAVIKFVAFHAACVLAAILFPLYVKISRLITLVIPGCVFHDFLRIYCPFCGGTRAAEALLSFDVGEALRYNALVVVLLAVGAVLYGIAWVRLCRGETRLTSIPVWGWRALLVAIILFGVVRNVLMLAFGIDPLGDLQIFWN